MRDKLLHVRNTEPGQPLQLEDGEWDGLTFRKELIYADDFHKRNATSNQKFTIDEMKLAHWEHVGNQMIADGVKVPTPLKHTDSPEANRGQIIRYERDTNSKGVPALYGVVKFRDAEAAKLANSTDISIFVPETPFYNGKGKKYEYGIRHVALTDYPVIPGLEGFVPIAASFDEFDSEPLELGLGSVLKNNSNRLLGTQIAGETVGETAHTKGQHKAAAGLLGASAYFGGKEAKRIAGRFGKTVAKQYKKGGIRRVARSLGQFNKVTRIKSAPSTFSSVYTKAPVKSGPIIGAIGKVARAVGRRIPLVGLASAAAGVGFGADAVKSGIEGAAYHAGKIKNAPNKKRHTLSLEFKQMVQGLKQDLQLDFGQPERLELGGQGSGPQKQGVVSRFVNGNVGTLAGVLALRAGEKSAELFDDASQMKKSAKYMPTVIDGRDFLGNIRKAPRKSFNFVRSAAGRASIRRQIKELRTGGSLAAAGAVGLGYLAQNRLRRAFEKDKELSLGGPGSGPQKGGLIKHNGLENRSVFDRIRMNVGKVKPHLQKIGKASVNIAKNVAKSPLTHMVATTEALNYAGKKIRGDDENRRTDSALLAGTGNIVYRALGAPKKVKSALRGALKQVKQKFGKTPKYKAFAKSAVAMAKKARTGAKRGVLIGGALAALQAKLLTSKRIHTGEDEGEQELSLGGPGSGPQKGGLIKHNGLENRSVFDRIRMNVGKVKPHLQKIGRASVNIAKNVAKSPLTHIAVEGEIANQAARKIRGDDDNRRLSAIATTSGVRSVIKNAKAFVKYDQDAMKYADKAYGATKSSHTAFWGNKIKAAKAASSIHGAAAVLGTGLTSIAISKLLTKKKPKDKELSLGGPGSGPNAGQSRGMFRTAKKRINIAGKRIGRLLGRMGGEVDKSAGRFGAHAGATIGRVVGEQGAIATSRLARMAAPTVARGEGVNYLAKKIRGDDENRRAVSYVAQGAGMSALKSVGRNRKVAAAVAALTGASLLMKTRKKQELSLGGPGSGPQKQSSARDAEEGHFRKAHRYGLASIITPVATRLAISRLQKFKRFGGKSTIATALLGAGATGYAGYKSVKHNILGLKERYKRKKSLLPDMHNNIGSAILRELSLGVIIDAVGNHHAEKGGRFVAKMDGERSARSQRRNLTSLKPKKYHYEDIGNVPARENDESPREYKSRVRKLRNENKVENPNYYKDFSEEDVKSNPVASTHQGIKHAALTTVAATGAVGATAGAYAAGKSLVKEVQSQASRMSKKTDWKAKAAKANKELGTKRGALTRASKAGEAKVISAAKKSVLSAEAKATAMKILAEGTNTKTRTKVQLGKSILKAAHRILKNKNTKWRLLGVAAATAAAATGAHETKQHYDATQYHLGNVAKTLSDFKNSGLIKRQ